MLETERRTAVFRANGGQRCFNVVPTFKLNRARTALCCTPPPNIHINLVLLRVSSFFLFRSGSGFLQTGLPVWTDLMVSFVHSPQKVFRCRPASHSSVFSQSVNVHITLEILSCGGGESHCWRRVQDPPSSLMRPMKIGELEFVTVP